MRNGWLVPPDNAGQFSLIPLDNAAAQLTQIGLLPPDEAIYFFSTKDIEGRSLDGRKHYTLTFARGELPPVEQLGFWSLTMYRASNLFLVNNPIDRYVIRPDTPGLALNKDGSLTVHISAENPRRCRRATRFQRRPSLSSSPCAPIFRKWRSAMEAGHRPVQVKSRSRRNRCGS